MRPIDNLLQGFPLFCHRVNRSVGTSAHADSNVGEVDEISDVIGDEPPVDVLVMQLPEDSSCNDDHHVVDDGQRDDHQPAIVNR